MRKLFRRLLLLYSFTLLPLFIAFTYGDPPGPPRPGGNPGSGGILAGGPAGGPIGDTIGILITLGVVFGCFKLYEFWRIGKVQRELY